MTMQEIRRERIQAHLEISQPDYRTLLDDGIYRLVRYSNGTSPYAVLGDDDEFIAGYYSTYSQGEANFYRVLTYGQDSAE